MTTTATTPAAQAYDAHRAAIIAKAQALIAKLQGEHADLQHWGHVGSLEKVRAEMDEINRFMGL